jgi:hypothetical protein
VRAVHEVYSKNTCAHVTNVYAVPFYLSSELVFITVSGI